MDPQIVVRATGDFRSLYGDLAKSEGRLNRLGRTAARGAAIGIGIAGAAAVKFGIDSVKAASSSQQSIGATESVFGKYADVVIRRSEEAAEALGLSANEYRELSNVTGAMLSSAGTPLRKVTGLTADLNERAADMAATFGGETADAVRAISSLLRGEADPIEAYGVSIKQSDINARLAAKGLDDLEGSARKQAEQQERLALLFNQTSSSAGQFARESDTLAGAQARLGAKFEDVKAKAGTVLLPALTDLANFGSDALDELVEHGDDLRGMWDDIRGAVAPAVDEIVEAFGNMTGEGDGLADLFNDKFIPALTLTSEVVGALVNFIDELPGPVKDLGVEVGLAAIAFGILGPRITAAKVAMSGLVGTTATAATRMAALRTAAGGVAGIAGILAIAKSADEANNSLAILERTAGGVLLGFAVGGPIGAAVGGTAALATGFDELQGAMYDWVGVADPAEEEARQIAEGQDAAARATARHDTALRDLTATLNAGRNTAQSLAPAYANLVGELEANGITASTATRQWELLGISQRTVAQASLGNANAIRRLAAAYQNAPLRKRIIDEHTLSDAIDNTVVTNRKAIREERVRLRLTQEWAGKLRDFPREARSAIRLDGVQPTLRGVAKVASEYRNIDKKDIKAILEVTGVEATVADVRRVQRDLDDTGKRKPKPSITLSGVLQANADINSVDRNLVELNGNSAHTYVYNHRITVYEQQGEPRGPRGRELLDDPLGVESLIEELGRETAPKAERAGRNVILRLLRGITGGTSQVKSALGRLTDYIEKKIQLEDDKKERAREKRVLAHLKDEYAALIRNGQAQDAINRKLERAREHLAEVKDFVQQIKQGFVDTGNIVNLGQLDDGAVSGPLLLDQLRDKVIRAQQFAQLIRELSDDIGPKLNQTSLQQLLAAGPDAGLAAAQALALGGAAAIDEINDLTAQLAAAGAGLGADMSDQFFDLGLDASQALVDGLAAQSAALDRAARRLARRLAQAVRNALGGKRGGGGDGRALAESLGDIPLGGLTATHARTTGRTFGAAMLAGFRTAQLDGGAVPEQRISVRVTLTAEEESQLRRGKAVTLDINAGAARGVRRTAVSGSR